ncbi:MAG: flagellin [Candidatus Delongbacteria bacterium]
MALRINHNIPSLSVQRALANTTRELGVAVERLSSGLRINKAWDDPAGLAVSEKFRAQIASMVEAERNASQGINLLATAEGAMAILDDKLIRMRALSVEAANGTLTSLDRSYLDVEFQQLKSEITRIASVTNYNGLNLLDGTYSQGSASGGIRLQVGTFAAANVDTYQITINDMTASALGLASVDLTNTASAQSAITLVDSAINTKDTERTRIGSYVERLQYTIQNLQVQHENAVDSESTIRDADMAEETSAFVRAQILMQSGVAMLAQANQIPQFALSLI